MEIEWLALRITNGKAMKDFNEAIRLDPECTDAYGWRGAVRLEQNWHDEAIWLEAKGSAEIFLP